MTVWIFLALVLVNGQPELKGGTFKDRAACEERRAQAIALFDTQDAMPKCEPLVLVKIAPVPPRP